MCQSGDIFAVFLSSWEKEKVKTLNDVAALDTRFEMSKKNNKRTGKGYSKRTEVVPDWLRKQEEQKPYSSHTKLKVMILKIIRNVWMRF